MPREVVGALRWYLEIDGIAEAIFREVTGLDSETEVIEHRVTGKGGNIVVHKIPGALKWSNIVMRRGVTDDRKLHDWRQKIEEGQIEGLSEVVKKGKTQLEKMCERLRKQSEMQKQTLCECICRQMDQKE